MIGDVVPFLNHGVQGRSRVATQYTASTRFLAYLQALLASSDELEGVLQTVAKQSDIDIAEGVNLDVIGIIVGVNRGIPNAIPLDFFGFEGFPGANPFGEEGLLGFGARFREEDEAAAATSVLADPEYRLLIRAKIIKNHSHGTNEDIIAGLTFLFGAEGMQVEDFGGMEIGIVSARQLTSVEIAMLDELDILPRPAGVKIRRRTMFIPDNYFGFEGQPNAKGFGEEGDISIGGLFAEEF